MILHKKQNEQHNTVECKVSTNSQGTLIKTDTTRIGQNEYHIIRSGIASYCLFLF